MSNEQEPYQGPESLQLTSGSRPEGEEKGPIDGSKISGAHESGDEVKRRLTAIERQLDEAKTRDIGQEHRVVAIIQDFRSHKGDSSRRWLSVLAFGRWALSNIGRPLAAISAGIAAFMGLYLAYEANQKLQEQNSLVEKQNQFFQRQIEQEATQDFRARRTQLLAMLYDTRPCDDDGGMYPTSSCRARVEAAATLVRIEGTVRADQAADESNWPGVVVAKRTSLTDVDLGDCQLSQIDLRDANLSRANLTNADLNHADLRHAYLRSAYLHGADLTNVDLTGADLSSAGLSNADLTDANLNHTIFTNTNLYNAKLDHADLAETNLASAYLGGALLYCADLSNADLNNSDLSNANLLSADLTDSNLSNANLLGADLTDANLLGTNLFNSQLVSDDARLYSANGLTGEQLESAKNVPDEAWELVGGRFQEVE